MADWSIPALWVFLGTARIVRAPILPFSLRRTAALPRLALTRRIALRRPRIEWRAEPVRPFTVTESLPLQRLEVVQRSLTPTRPRRSLSEVLTSWAAVFSR